MVNLRVGRSIENQYGAQGQSAMYRAELNARRKSRTETLQNLQQDIRRLMSLAYEDPHSKTSTAVAVDAFLRALDDRKVAKKVQELEPKDLDEVLRHALRFEAYAKNRAVDCREGDARKRRDDGFVKATENKVQTEALPSQVVTGTMPGFDMEEYKRMVAAFELLSN